MRATSTGTPRVSTTSGSTGTISCRSCGKTSRNHPMLPARLSTTPTRLTATLVSSPVNSSVRPKANTIGHTVGAGSSTEVGSFAVSVRISSAMLRSSSDQVHYGENDDPNHVYKMPVQREHIHVLGVCLVYLARERQKHYQRQPHQTRGHVKCVQPHQRVIGGAEKIRRDCQSPLVNQAMPLAGRAHQKNRAQRQCDKPENPERADVPPLECSHREMDGQAAREQANRGDDGNLQHLPRHRPAQAFSDVIDVGHDEYREDGRFPRDQAKHPDTPSRRQYPRPFRYGHCCWQRAHVFPLQFENRNARSITRISSPDLPDA